MMTPAVYWSASSGPMNGRNRCLKKSHPRKAMLKGLTSQLTKRVTKSPLGRRPIRAIEVKSILSIIGTIMSQMSTAMGALIWLPEPNSSRRSSEMSEGASRPRATPATMQRATQRLR